jgi:hypothetical protein
MADPFSIAAGALGTIGFALQTIAALCSDIQAIQNAPVLITSLRKDLEVVHAVLQQFNSPTNLTTLHTLHPEAQSALWLAIHECAQACHAFRAKVQKWTSRSADGKMHWWVRARVGLFEVAEIGFLREALAASKETMTAALASATLYAF